MDDARPTSKIWQMRRWWKRDARDELIDELRGRIRSLERRLDEGEESRRRTDTIIAQLTQANTALTEQLLDIEAPPEERHPTELDSEVSAQGDSYTWWEKAAKSTLPAVAGPLVTAVISGIITLLATIEGATVVALFGFGAVVISVLGLVVGFYYGGQTAVRGTQSAAQAGTKAATIAAAQAAAARVAAETPTRSDEDRPPDEDESMPERPSEQDTKNESRRDG